MNKEKLLGIIKTKGLQVQDVIQLVNENGTSMSASYFYKGLRDERPFKVDEIKALANILYLSDEEIVDIFFKEIVSKKTLQVN